MNRIKHFQKLFILLFLIITIPAQAQNYNYAWTVAGGSTGIDEGKGVTTDNFKNVYVAGSFTGTVDFDPGAGVNTLTASGTGSGYLAKYDANGNFLWVLQISGSVGASGSGICSDTSNNVYIIGEVNGVSGDFDPGAGVSTITSAGQTDVYIAKYTGAGQFVWVQQFGGTSNEYARKIKAGKNDELVVTCNFQGTVDFDPGPGTNIVTSAGSSDVFIARLYTNGILDWVKTIGNSGGNEGPGIGIDEYGSIYSVGGFSGTLDTDPDTAATSFLTAFGTASDAVLIKLDSNGIFQWSKNLSSNSAALINDVQPDGDNNIYLTGWIAGFADFDPGAGLDTMTNISGIDVFLWKMTYSGNHVWARRAGNSLPEFYDGRSVKIDGNGNPFVLGIFEGTADFDPGLAIRNETSLGDFDIFVWGLSSTDGAYLFSKSVGGTGKEVSPDLHMDDANNIYFTGFFTGQVDFNPWAGTNLISPASSVADFHINKWSNCAPTTSTVIDSACNNLFVFNGQTYTNSGTYIQTLLNSVGCDSIITLQLTLTNIDTATTVSGATITSLQNGASYQWYTCNGTWSAIPNANQQSFTATQNGQYAVVVTLNGCSDTSRCLSVLGVGINHMVGSNFCNIFPNPSSGEVYFDWSTGDFNGTIYIFNSVGQLLEEIQVSGQPQTKIRLNHAPGNYVVKIKAKNGEMLVPLILN
jgi:hypothetical protein